MCRHARLPRLVTVEWIEESWKEQTLLDEERESWFRYALLCLRDLLLSRFLATLKTCTETCNSKSSRGMKYLTAKPQIPHPA